MKDIQSSDIEMAAIVAVVMSLFSVPYLDWWGLLVGPSMVLMFAWAYYSMSFAVWLIDLLRR